MTVLALRHLSAKLQVANKMPKKKDHSCKFVHGIKAYCICGWESGRYWGRGMTAGAAGAYHNHVEDCEKAKESQLAAAPDAGGV